MSPCSTDPKLFAKPWVFSILLFIYFNYERVGKVNAKHRQRQQWKKSTAKSLWFPIQGNRMEQKTQREVVATLCVCCVLSIRCFWHHLKWIPFFAFFCFYSCLLARFIPNIQEHKFNSNRSIFSALFLLLLRVLFGGNLFINIIFVSVLKILATEYQITKQRIEMKQRDEEEKKTQTKSTEFFFLVPWACWFW